MGKVAGKAIISWNRNEGKGSWERIISWNRNEGKGSWERIDRKRVNMLAVKDKQGRAGAIGYVGKRNQEREAYKHFRCFEYSGSNETNEMGCFSMESKQTGSQLTLYY
jgi:hypothetical protein